MIVSSKEPTATGAIMNTQTLARISDWNNAEYAAAIYEAKAAEAEVSELYYLAHENGDYSLEAYMYGHAVNYSDTAARVVRDLIPLGSLWVETEYFGGRGSASARAAQEMNGASFNGLLDFHANMVENYGWIKSTYELEGVMFYVLCDSAGALVTISSIGVLPGLTVKSLLRLRNV
jgi:hypothetical protein